MPSGVTKRCAYCQGTKQQPGIGKCRDCGGRGVVCAICWQRLSECECPREYDEPQRCRMCGKLELICDC